MPKFHIFMVYYTILIIIVTYTIYMKKLYFYSQLLLLIHAWCCLKSSRGLPNFEIPKITKYKVGQLCKKIRPKNHKLDSYFCVLYFFCRPTRSEKSPFTKKVTFVFCFLLLPQGTA